MIIKMHLTNEFFQLLKSGKKDIEIRLLDEKRSKLKVGDTILFECKNDVSPVSIINISIYASFEDMVKSIDIKRIGNFTSSKDLLNALYNIYPKYKASNYKVLAITIKRLV